MSTEEMTEFVATNMEPGHKVYGQVNAEFGTWLETIRGGGETWIDTEHLGCTSYGYVASGGLGLWDHDGNGFHCYTGEYFALPNLVEARPVSDDTKAFLATRQNFVGLRTMGGPIESVGRLRYIDGCTDSLLIHPPRKGNPCLNLLHFPPGIDQTFHTHPSVRCGVVARGSGICTLPTGDMPLEAGMVFVIPPGGVHRFRTPNGVAMDVIAYHPDSDWGPEDEVHPMLNRTWVDGKAIDNTTEQHAIVDG